MSRTKKKHKNMVTHVRLDAKRVLFWRAARHLTQLEAAKLANISPVTFARCETGKPIRLLSAAQLADKMKIELRDLIDNNHNHSE